MLLSVQQEAVLVLQDFLLDCYDNLLLTDPDQAYIFSGNVFNLCYHHQLHEEAYKWGIKMKYAMDNSNAAEVTS